MCASWRATRSAGSSAKIRAAPCGTAPWMHHISKPSSGRRGSDTDLSSNTGSVADIRTASISSGVNHNVDGSGGIGTDGNPANGGSGINIFSNPQQVYDSFRAPLLSVDGRTGKAHPIYGFGFWNFDMRVGKVTNIAERVKMELSADAFNLFSNVNFADPLDPNTASLNINNPAAFGVVTASQTLTNHNSPSRYLCFETQECAGFLRKRFTNVAPKRVFGCACDAPP